jgi:hypothetical protein
VRRVLALAALIVAGPAWAERFQVGSSREHERPSAVATLAQDGDVVEIDAGEYVGDVAVWHQNRLTLRGTGGRAHLKAAGHSAQGKAIWVIKGRGTTVERIEFSGAEVPDGNGAGIRAEGPDLVLRDCYFHDNQNGILGGAGNVLIENSEFARNGSGDGYTHNIYILDHAERFTLRYSYSHHAKVGHNLKSRARENYIQYNRIMDEADGTSSYTIDLPNGGLAYLVGNLIQQGPRTENPVIVSYGAEGLKTPHNALYLVNNTLVNDSDRGVFLRVVEGATRALAVNNLFVGPGQAMNGNVESRNNLSVSDAKLADRVHYDYRLVAGSPAINAGVDPGKADGTSLTPTDQYVHPRQHAPRRPVGAPDVGAYEFDGGARP